MVHTKIGLTAFAFCQGPAPARGSGIGWRESHFILAKFYHCFIEPSCFVWQISKATVRLWKSIVAQLRIWIDKLYELSTKAK